MDLCKQQIHIKTYTDFKYLYYNIIICITFDSAVAVAATVVTVEAGLEAAAIEVAGMQFEVLDMTDVFMAVAPTVTTDEVELDTAADIVVANEFTTAVVFSTLAVEL